MSRRENLTVGGGEQMIGWHGFGGGDHWPDDWQVNAVEFMLAQYPSLQVSWADIG